MTVAMSRRRCVYCGGSEGSRLTKEHIISKSVMRVAFGPDIRNVTRSPIWGSPPVLLDYEATIRDVCQVCNQALSDYDEAGVTLVTAIQQCHDAAGTALPFSPNILGWLLKTHLNEMRVTPSSAFRQPAINPAIYAGLRHHSKVPTDLYRLFVEGWRGAAYFWAEDDPRRIPYFFYKSVKVVDVEIVVSNFRIKWLDTFVLLPANESYRDFSRRCDHARTYVARTIGFDWQEVALDEVLAADTLRISKVVPLGALELIMRPTPL